MKHLGFRLAFGRELYALEFIRIRQFLWRNKGEYGILVKYVVS
jgi:hypothetical protein